MTTRKLDLGHFGPAVWECQCSTSKCKSAQGCAFLLPVPELTVLNSKLKIDYFSQRTGWRRHRGRTGGHIFDLKVNLESNKPGAWSVVLKMFWFSWMWANCPKKNRMRNRPKTDEATAECGSGRGIPWRQFGELASRGTPVDTSGRKPSVRASCLAHAELRGGISSSTLDFDKVRSGEQQVDWYGADDLTWSCCWPCCTQWCIFHR